MSTTQVSTSSKLDKLTAELRELVKSNARGVVLIGKKLLEVKDMLQACPAIGDFSDWLDREFLWSRSTAERFMRCAKRFPDLRQIDDFASTALYLLSSPSVEAEALDEALSRAAEGEKITYSVAKEIIAQHRSIEKSMEDMTPGEKLRLMQEEEAMALALPEDEPTGPTKTPIEQLLTHIKKMKKIHAGLVAEYDRKRADRALDRYEQVVRGAG